MANGNTTQKQVTRKAYSINKAGTDDIEFKSLFVTENGTVESVYTDKKYAEYKITGNAVIKYLNSVLSENASIIIQTDKVYKDVDEVIVCFSDPIRKGEKVDVRFKSFDGAAFVSLNGGEFKTVVGGDFSGDNALDITYIDSARAVTVNGVSYSFGDDFCGFGVDYLTLEIEVVGVRNDSVYGLIVEKVGNQAISSSRVRDVVAPMISPQGDYGGSYAIGSKYLSP
ncbi:MAG: hypothetical protein J6Y43_02405, partial [Clostridia bacterium]|nr:hypothetical protein [Clostridia bacterium]